MEHSQQRAQSDLTLSHDRLYYKDLPKDVDVHEGLQFLALASVGDYDLLFWISPYVQLARTPAGFLGREPAVLNTMMFAVPKDQRGKMNDNDFICKGWNPSEHLKLEDLKVGTGEKEVVWRIKNTEFVCHPPYWEVRGSHEGLTFDLKFTGTAPTSFYLKGDFDSLLKGESKAVNFDQLTSCTGTISMGEKTYEITEGYGCHEHPVIIIDMVKGFRKPMHWFVGGNGGLRFFHITQGNWHHGGVLVDGKYLVYDSGVTLDVLDWWHDPRSLATIPSKWHVNMRSSEGIFDIHATASGRANRIWALGNGYVLDVWILGTVNGNFLYPDGRVIPIEDMLFEVEWLRTIWP